MSELTHFERVVAVAGGSESVVAFRFWPWPPPPAVVKFFLCSLGLAGLSIWPIVPFS